MDALLLAKENAESSVVLSHIEFVNGDLFSPFRLFKGRKPFDLILSNPPYITCSEIQELAREVRDYEPIIALDGGEDGLEFYRSITSQAPFYLRKGGWLLLEVGQGQAGKVLEMIEKGGHFKMPERIKDLSGIERVVKAQDVKKIQIQNPNVKSKSQIFLNLDFEIHLKFDLWHLTLKRSVHDG